MLLLIVLTVTLLVNIFCLFVAIRTVYDVIRMGDDLIDYFIGGMIVIAILGSIVATYYAVLHILQAIA
jgi:hypothetical protein